MPWDVDYKRKLMSPADAVRCVESGMRVYIHPGCAEPERLVSAMVGRAGELRNVDVVRRDGALVISGIVSSFYHKQLAQEVVRTVCKDCEVELSNLIRVR